MSDHCDACPVPGRPCPLRARGQCHEAAREAAVLAIRPGAATPFRDKALAHVSAALSGIPDDPPLPSLARQAVGFVATAAAVLADGMQEADAGERARRASICGLRDGARLPVHCKHLRPDLRCGMMTGCGCHMPAKLVWRAARCPVGKW